ncbi:unnamed protein product [Cyprideis torosa]|uniref:Snurportin-1 n=1 Tax=Cyprideis torosa TaxID=163714 RepID=A0A7R8ZKW5_9CRUS|nr:unnamed protein product [Cyprideis torosa]CAG0882433.1 unnamed protein product [Cyprideis torosa]
MEEAFDQSLSEVLAASLSVGHEQNSTSGEHPRFSSLYKANAFTDKAVSQKKRREDVLKRQKRSRESRLDGLRSAISKLNSDDHEKGNWRENITYKDALMLSEWLLDIPDDLSSDWLMVPCPEGKRTLVVAEGGRTKSFAKSGHLLSTFVSYLPGGGKGCSGFTLLDCIHSFKDHTYFVIDVMAWRKSVYTDSDTECRFFMKKSLFEDLEQPKERSHRYGEGQKRVELFEPLPAFACTEQEIWTALWGDSLPFHAPLDGLLFYHKSLVYVSGVTPAVGWLKPYMVSLVLGIAVPEAILLRMPQSLLQEHYPHLLPLVLSHEASQWGSDLYQQAHNSHASSKKSNSETKKARAKKMIEEEKQVFQEFIEQKTSKSPKAASSSASSSSAGDAKDHSKQQRDRRAEALESMTNALKG